MATRQEIGSKLPSSKTKRKQEDKAQCHENLQGPNPKYLFPDIKTEYKDIYYISKSKERF